MSAEGESYRLLRTSVRRAGNREPNFRVVVNCSSVLFKRYFHRWGTQRSAGAARAGSTERKLIRRGSWRRISPFQVS